MVTVCYRVLHGGSGGSVLGEQCRVAVVEQALVLGLCLMQVAEQRQQAQHRRRIAALHRPYAARTDMLQGKRRVIIIIILGV